MNARARFTERIWRLSERAEREVQAFEPPADPPDEQQAMDYLREGAGPAISLFVEARTGQHNVQFQPDAYRALEQSMNDWLELYAACYGVDMDAEYALRKAAQLLIDTENIKDVAVVLTSVP
ncbi:MULTISPECIES: hypothetical protein [Salinibaculum]|uniref:hypothetical protein n=1 Tax=Salinibaculum TaxID=2732368 RepID=UPI0030D35A9B